MKKVFTNPFSKWLLVSRYWSSFGHLSVKNKLISGDEDITFLGEEMADSVLKRKLKPNITITSFWTPSSTYVSVGKKF
jgi:UDP-2,3-diacylglucosamine hydrolase